MRAGVIRFPLTVVAAIALGACANSAATPAPSTPAPLGHAPAPVETNVAGFVLTSPAFVEGGAMPAKSTCNGGDISPALHWTGAPAATRSFALIVEDPDASDFIHWVAYGIPGGTSGDLAEGITEAGPPLQALNSFGANGYRGPCPPSGTHHYVFTLFALAGSFTLANRSTASADDVRAAMKVMILARTTLTGTYTTPG